MGVGDQVPPAIEQLGAKVEMISADDLAWGDLSRFDAIVTGVRAYERRDDLRANNSRLLEYVFNGGTMIVQYNKFEFNDAQYGPYPAKVSANRVTDENAPVQILDAAQPAVHDAERDRRGGVEELGAGARHSISSARKDSRYHDVLQMEDNFPVQQGDEDRRAGRGELRQGTLGVRRPGPVAAAAGPAPTARISCSRT